MRKSLGTLASVAFFAIALIAALGVHTWFQRPLVFGWFLDRMLVEEAIEDPETLTGLRVLEPWGIRAHNAKLTDVSPEAALRRLGRAKENLATLEGYDRAGLSPANQIAYDVAHFELKDEVDGEPFVFHDYPVSQVFGVQSELPTFLVTEHVVADERDAKDYLARLSEVGTQFDQVLEGLKLRENRNLLPPHFLAVSVIEQMKGFIAPPPAENLLVTSFREKLAKVDALSQPQRDALVNEAVASVKANVYPAYERMVAYFEALLPKLTADEGVWRQPQGDAYYAWAVRHHTTTDLTPEQVHQLGLAEVARIEAEMDAILKSQGSAQGSVGTRIRALAADPRFRYPDAPESKAQVIADFQHIIDEMDAGLGPYFHLRPASKVVVQAVPAFKEKTSPGAYYDSPPLDRSRPGVFWINLRAVGEIQKFAMHTLAYHEAIPGHHFQIGVAQELKGVPLYQRLGQFTAYTEGWALYAERLAHEIGFEKDPYDDLGRLQGEMLRAVRLVVDSGMHYKRWSREQAVEYMADKTGSPQVEVAAEIDRYLAWPGQALAYKVGMLEILRLREEAKTKLGDRFSLPEFHDVVLGAGSMPLGVLRTRVEAWEATKSGGG